MTDRYSAADVFGCDPGNGFGYVSVLEDREADPRPMFPPQYRLEKVGMPTTAYLTPPTGEPIEVFSREFGAGGAAERRHADDPERLIPAVKTRLQEESIRVRGIEAPVEVDAIYAAIVRDLVSLANEQRRNMGKEPIYDLVFAYPALFADDLTLLNRMSRSIESVTLDGHPLHVVDRLPEPGAVAIDYLWYMQHLAPEEIRITRDHFTVLVYDLGHGTFDTAIVTARSVGEPYQLLWKSSLPDVGGQDFDRVLAGEIGRVLREEHGYTPDNALERERLRAAAVECKHELTDSDRSLRHIQLPGGRYANVTVTAERFEELGAPLLAQTLELMQTALQVAQERSIAIDAVVLSGGASQMPMVEKGLRQLVGDAIPVVLHRPGEAVSFGAARYAGGLNRKKKPAETYSGPNSVSKDEEAETKGQALTPNTVLEQFAEHAFGLRLPEAGRRDGVVRFLIPQGEKLPAQSGPICVSSASDRVRIELYRSEGSTPPGGEAEPQTCASVMRIPFSVPAGTWCEVRLTALEDGNLQVICRTKDGTETVKSTADPWEKLLASEGE